MLSKILEKLLKEEKTEIDEKFEKAVKLRKLLKEKGYIIHGMWKDPTTRERKKFRVKAVIIPVEGKNRDEENKKELDRIVHSVIPDAILRDDLWGTGSDNWPSTYVWHESPSEENK